MTDYVPESQDERMGKKLERSFRKAVREARQNNYVYFTDRKANKDIAVGPDFVVHSRNGRPALIIECKRVTDQKSKNSA